MAIQNHPLNALRAFEASARRSSFVKAAAALHVTPAAVSHQVKNLEDYLGIQLFRRLPRGLVLTEAGQMLLPELTEGFARLDNAVERVLVRDAQGAIAISVAPMFTAKWLVPRLQQFAALHADIDLRVSTNLAVVDFQRDAFDAAIRLGRGRYPGLEAVKLFDETVTPMCSPRLLEGRLPPQAADDLRDFVLLHDDSMQFDSAAPGWRHWLEAAGARHDVSDRGPHLSQPDHVLQAAIDGAGVALGWRCLADDDIAAGRLVAPFSLQLPLGSAFYLVYPQAHTERRKITVLRRWLVEETERFRA